MRRNRAGHTLIELLTALLLLSALVRLGVPRYHEMRKKALAAKLVGDAHSIRVAAFAYNAEHGTFPAEAGPGVIPPDLVPHLPDGFSFTQENWSIDWEVWELLSGGGNDDVLAVTFTPQDPALVAVAARLAGAGFSPIESGGNLTLFVSGLPSTAPAQTPPGASVRKSQ